VDHTVARCHFAESRLCFEEPRRARRALFEIDLTRYRVIDILLGVVAREASAVSARPRRSCVGASDRSSDSYDEIFADGALASLDNI
jgi:hypothetical protein